MTYDLERFVEAQKGSYPAAVAELRRGRKTGQPRGLGPRPRGDYRPYLNGYTIQSSVSTTWWSGIDATRDRRGL